MNLLKLFTALLFVTSTTALLAQQDVKTVDMNKINGMKKAGKLTGKEHFVNYDAKGLHPFKITNKVAHNATNGCNCWIDRDSTWNVVSFDGSGVNGGPGAPPEYRNDDWSSDVIGLPFTFCFYGDPINDVYINNNGNLSMLNPYPDYTSTPFPNSLYEMIAPFWADVDSRDLSSGLVYYKLTNSSLIIQWENVGYYDTHSDLVNSFQMVITNNTDLIIPDSDNVSFCYKDMQWTTGDASIGINGFYGTPATVGINKGNGIEYIQIGQFDQPGNAFDGPFGNNDGIDALDNQYFYFNVCAAGNNVPPIVNLPIGCDTVTISPLDTFALKINFLSPEQNQFTTITYNAPGINGLTDVINPGNFASIEFRAPGNLNAGNKTIHVYATDNGTPPATSTATINLNFSSATGINDLHSTSKNITVTNPVSDICTINSSSYTNSTLKIFDFMGRVLIEEYFNVKATVNVNMLSKGIYIIELSDKKGNKSQQKFEKL